LKISTGHSVQEVSQNSIKNEKTKSDIAEETIDKNLNKTFLICVTGKVYRFANRKELIEFIENKGHKFIDSVSKKIDYLVNNDPSSSSSKNQKARELDIPIISEEELLKILGT
jgi:DNA ligase (NAD+)